MNLAYFSHSYRPEDARIVGYFAQLIRSEGIMPSLDPPSNLLNSAKLESHTRTVDGMVAVVTRRQGGVSPHILYEITLCIRARKPLLVYIEDELQDDLIPARVLQSRFSRRHYLREIREHRYAAQLFRAYLGKDPPPRYQPSTHRRACLLLGMDALSPTSKRALAELIEAREYTVFEPCDFDGSLIAIYDAIDRSLSASTAWTIPMQKIDTLPE